MWFQSQAPGSRAEGSASRSAPCDGVPEDDMDVVFALLVVVAVGLLLLLGASLRVVTQFEKGVVLRFGRLQGEPREPGLTMIAPIADRMHKVNMQVITMPVPAQEGITRDNVTVKVDAVVYFKVFDPVRVVVGVQSYQAAIDRRTAGFCDGVGAAAISAAPMVSMWRSMPEMPRLSMSTWPAI